MAADHVKGLFYLSKDRSMYIGTAESKYVREYVSDTLLVSLGESFEVLDSHSDRLQYYKTLLIPSNTKLSINTQKSPIAFCKLDDFGKDLDALKRNCSNQLTQFNNDFYAGIKEEKRLIQDVESTWHNRADEKDAFESVSAWVNFFRCASSNQIDPRIRKVVSTIQSTHNENVTVQSLAESVNLSVTQLSYLFKLVTGSSIRRFRVWQRVLFSAERVSRGMSLQDTALDLGFSDFAHFSRSFKKMTGGKVSSANSLTEVKILT